MTGEITLSEDAKTAAISTEFLDQLKKFEKSLREKHEKISKEKTPPHKVKTRPDGYDYVEESYIREKLNKKFPLWSWTQGKTQLIGAEWVIVEGVLKIVDNGVTREFYSVGAARIQFKKGQPHTPENVIDIDKNVAAANTNAFKRAVNRLCNIADDIYRKEMDRTLTQVTKKKLKSLIPLLPEDKQKSIGEYLEKYELTEDEAKRWIKKIEEIINTQRELEVKDEMERDG